MNILNIFMALIGLLVWVPALAVQISVETILPGIEVDSEGDRNVFATPFDYRDGQVFTVHVEPSDGSGTDGVNLRTVVRHGTRQPDGYWKWVAKVLENRTIRDTWHTQASIALDKLGYVHVAYNMHNMPWQYSVSAEPLDISSFIFQGQSVSMDEIETVKFKNKTPFPRLDAAAIPGSQITYPMFFKDPVGDLYVTYRFALKPARSWEQRAFAGAVAKYDSKAKTWSPMGGSIQIERNDAVLAAGQSTATQYPFAFEDGYSVYLITLAFDEIGGMHAFWNWRPDGAGMETISPSYVFSPDGSRFMRSDGSAYRMPIQFKESDVITPHGAPKNYYYAPKSVAVLSNGEPAVVIQPLSGGRQLITLDRTTKRWRSPEPTPWGASEIIVDKQGRLWAFASGLKVFMRPAAGGAWEEIGEIGHNFCSPKPKYFPDESRFVVHAKSCDGRQVTIFTFRR